ncbi:acyl-CoA dehydrogenase family protein [Nocardia tengchongensis]|uniref:acyl-CoA dehydrogenase family protein n=1 Tax=Nocardia tengchongensis TaxID=2055889 RepID=UPI0036971A28
MRRREFGRKLGARGCLYPAAPHEYGGGGLDDGSVILLMEEMHRVAPCSALYIVLPTNGAPETRSAPRPKPSASWGPWTRYCDHRLGGSPAAGRDTAGDGSG